MKFCPVAEMDDLKNEIGMQCLSKHPNIVTLREAFVTKTEVRRRFCCMWDCRREGLGGVGSCYAWP